VIPLCEWIVIAERYSSVIVWSSLFDARRFCELLVAENLDTRLKSVGIPLQILVIRRFSQYVFRRRYYVETITFSFGYGSFYFNLFWEKVDSGRGSCVRWFTMQKLSLFIFNDSKLSITNKKYHLWKCYSTDSPQSTN